MSDELDEVTPREVLDGEWLSCWEAVEEVEEILRRYAVQTELPAGQIIARMSAMGYLPTISNDQTHTAPIDPSDPDPDKMSEEERERHLDEKLKAGEEREREIAQGGGTWRLVSPGLWGALFGFCAIENRRVHHAQADFKNSSMIATFTTGEFVRNAELWKVMGDPGFHMQMARNILIYRDGLYSVERFVQGYPDEDDKYSYNKVDLSRLRLPAKLPLANSARFRRMAQEDEEAVASSTPSRGRPGGKNGEPIAALTIRLMSLEPAVLDTYTAEAAGSELQSIYAMLGSPNRNIDNCRKDAAGVLRQVRGART